MFEKLDWQADRVLLHDLVFRIEYTKRDDWELGEACLALYKTKPLYDEYERFFALRPDHAFKNVLELGIWGGGSVALWFECLQPEKYVALDLAQRGDTPYFRWYVASRHLRERIRTYWGVNQADRARLRAMVASEFQGPLDLVLDDCSHRYGATKASFETLFPRLRPGGFYIIEDWAWAHVPQHQGPASPFAREIPLTRLAVELLEAVGTGPSLMASLHVGHGFVAIERGPATIPDPDRFHLDAAISRRPAVGLRGRVAATLARLAETR